MATLIQITTHVADSKDKVLQQYKEKNFLLTMIGAWVTENQTLEQTFFDLINNRGVDTAVGVNLDQLGTIVGQVRIPGQSDTDYRIAIKTKIAENISQGEPERIISIYKALTLSNFVILDEFFPAEVALEGGYTPSDQGMANSLILALESIAPAGVRVNGLVAYSAAGDSFAYEGGPEAALGYDDGSGTVGGKYASYWTYKLPFAYEGPDSISLGYGSSDDPLVGGVYV